MTNENLSLGIKETSLFANVESEVPTMLKSIAIVENQIWSRR